ASAAFSLKARWSFFRDGDRLPRPGGQISRTLHHVERHGVVARAAAGFVEIRLERFHPGADVIGAVAIVGLEEERVAREDAEEDAVAIEADALEHRLGGHVAELVELIE